MIYYNERARETDEVVGVSRSVCKAGVTWLRSIKVQRIWGGWIQYSVSTAGNCGVHSRYCSILCPLLRVRVRKLESLRSPCNQLSFILSAVKSPVNLPTLGQLYLVSFI
jgi:hypothetical protein